MFRMVTTSPRCAAFICGGQFHNWRRLDKHFKCYKCSPPLHNHHPPSSPAQQSLSARHDVCICGHWRGEEEVITQPPEQHSDRISPHDLHFSKQINIFTGFSKWFNHDLGYLPPTRPPSHTHTTQMF